MPAAPAPPTPPQIDLGAQPGHLIRRLQQIAVGLFMEEAADFDLTPVQFGALAGIARQPGLDQRTLASAIGLDTSTIGGVIDRLERRALVQRQPSPEDRRVRRLVLTAAGARLLNEVAPAMARAQQRILDPLSGPEQQQFMRLMAKLVTANNGASRAPSTPGASG